MLNNQISVNVEFVIDALESRYNDVKDQWGCQASHDLWEQALQLVYDCGFNCSSASEYVDNYLINGEFISRFDMNENDCESYNIEFDINEEGEVIINDGEWSEYCQDNALIYNDEYACLRF